MNGLQRATPGPIRRGGPRTIDAPPRRLRLRQRGGGRLSRRAALDAADHFIPWNPGRPFGFQLVQSLVELGPLGIGERNILGRPTQALPEFFEEPEALVPAHLPDID